MGSFTSPAFIVNAGALGLVLLILFWLFMALKNGQLYTRDAVAKIEKAEQTRATKAEEREKEWKTIAFKWEETARLSTEQATRLLEQSQLTVELLRAIRDAQIQSQQNTYSGAHSRDRG